jgi:hypothetical protein
MLNITLKRLSTVSGVPLEGAEPTRVLLHSDGMTMVCTRNVKLRSCRVITTCNGTTGDFTKRANNIAQLDDGMFEDFARIQADSITSD